MGLLDNLFSDDPQKQALLMMGLGLLQGAPGQRKNFGADLGNAGLLGIQGYAQGKNQQQALAAAQQNQKLRDQQLAMGGIGLQNAQQDFADTQQARDILKGRSGQPPQNQSLDQGSTPSLYGGSVGPYAPPPQGMPQGPSSPSVVPFGKGQALTSSPASAGEGKFDTFKKYNAIADQFESNGLMKQAQQYRDLAEKYRPKLKDEQVRLQDGNPVVVRNYEDGSTEVSPFQPTASLQYLDTKNAKLPINNYTGKMGGQPIPMGIDPADAQRLAIERARLQYDTGMGGSGGGAGGGGGAPGLPPSVQAQIAKSQAEGLNTGGIAYKNNLDTTVQTGNDLMTRIAESRKALDQFKPGMGAETRLNVARFAQAIGAPDGLVSAINAGDVSAKQEFMKLSAQQAMETLKSAMGGSGRITQAEFKVFQANNPNIELDPNAITKIYDFAEKTHKRNVAEQAGLNDYLKQGGNISQWPSEWTKQVGGGLGQQAPQQPLQVNQTALYKAKQAIAQGKDPAAVRQRLIEQGYDPKGL